MQERRRVFLLILILTAVAVGAAGISLYSLYETALEEHKAYLVVAAKSHARMLESMARNNALHLTEGAPGRVLDRTIEVVADAHEHFEGFGATAEFVLAKREGEWIFFLLKHRHGKREHPEPVLFESNFAEPMRQALSGKAGTIVDLDYRGETVLAAYEPVAELGIGLVIKIDLAEVRTPFIRAGLLAGSGALVFVLLGCWVFLRLTDPLIRSLQESKAKYISIFEGSPNGVLLMTDTLEDCNPQATRLWSCRREEIIGHSLFDFLPPQQEDGRDSAQVVQQAIDAAFSGTPQFQQWKFRRKDGVLIDTDISLKAIEVGGRRTLLIIIRDISERRKMELTLHDSEKRYQTLTEVSPVGLFHTDTKGKFLYVNERWCEITGFCREEALKKGLTWGLHPEDRKRVLEEWCATAGEDIPYRSEYRILHTDGAISWVYGQIVVERDNDGEVVGYVGTITDISERKEIEEALQERNDFIEPILVDLPIGLIVLSLEDLTVQYLNPKIEEIAGWPRHRFTNLFELWERVLPDPAFRRQLIDRVCADMESGEQARMVWYFPITKESGEIAELFAHAIPLLERHQVVVTVQDVTEIKRSSDALRERNEFIETIMDNLPIGLAVSKFEGQFVLDGPYEEHHITYMNRRMEEILGWPKELLPNLASLWQRAFPDREYRKEVIRNAEEVVRSGEPMLWEWQISKRSGERADVLIADIPMFDKKMIITTVQDITERKQAQRVKAQLEFAAEVQSKLLPQKAPTAAGFEVAAWCLPAFQVGGDFYDWQEVAPGIISLTLGDVMGKGIAAAILMATVRATLRAVSQENPPALAMQSAVKALQQDLDSSDSFVTLFHAQLNQASRNLTYVDCGHGFVFLRRENGKVEELRPRGVPLGVPAVEEYHEGTVNLEEGDTLVLYSDGLIDAVPELGLDNMVLAKHLEGATSAREMVERLVGIVPPDTKQPDDLTVVVLRCKQGGGGMT